LQRCGRVHEDGRSVDIAAIYFGVHRHTRGAPSFPYQSQPLAQVSALRADRFDNDIWPWRVSCLGLAMS
jgi:hypothetical protein